MAIVPRTDDELYYDVMENDSTETFCEGCAAELPGSAFLAFDQITLCRSCRKVRRREVHELSAIAGLVHVLWRRKWLSEPVGVRGFVESVLPDQPPK